MAKNEGAPTTELERFFGPLKRMTIDGYHLSDVGTRQGHNFAAERAFSLREMINTSFEEVRALADGLLLELGPTRLQDLALRGRIVRWQPRLRMLFITRVTLWRYRVRLPGFELPAPVARAQQEFDKRLADVVERRVLGRSKPCNDINAVLDGETAAA